jgi:3-hydroxymyristoyl/3-hydroxydecanoyl-(acyl carrier protein) dehydratase
MIRLNNTLLDTWQPLEALNDLSSGLRFLEKVVLSYPQIQVVSRVHLNLERDFSLKDHIYQGNYIFPTVFGLEAMAQAVAFVTGEINFDIVRIEGLLLEQVITVHPQTGMLIEVYAEVLENDSPDGLRYIKA